MKSYTQLKLENELLGERAAAMEELLGQRDEARVIVPLLFGCVHDWLCRRMPVS